MRRIFVPPVVMQGDIINITDADDITYLSSVLRMKVGDELYVSDGFSRACEGKIKEICKSGILVDIMREMPLEDAGGPQITLYQGLPKGAKMDEIVRKATELGVYCIIPVITARVDGSGASRTLSPAKLGRLRRIAEEASRQSHRPRIPEVKDCIGFEEALAGLGAGAYDLLLVLFELEETRTLKQALRAASGLAHIGVFVGPEGGFEEMEIKRLVSNGAISVTIGETILRTETAGPAAIAMIIYEYGL